VFDNDYELEQKIESLSDKLEKLTRDLRLVEAPGLCVRLSVAELFASKRAAKLPAHVRALWNALNALEAQPLRASNVPIIASPIALVISLSDKMEAARKRNGILSPEFQAATKELHDAMYGAGRTRDEWNAHASALALERNIAAANIGF
jgi:hypothetical protein